MENKDLHRRKNEMYVKRYVRDVRPTPLVNLFRKVEQKTIPIVMTAASHDAAVAVLRTLGLVVSAQYLHTEMRKEDKAHELTKLAMAKDPFRDPGVIYFDDSPEVIDYLHNNMRRDIVWTACLVKFP